MNLGLGRSFRSIRRLHAANWLSAAKTRAAKVSLELKKADRKVKLYPATCLMSEIVLQMIWNRQRISLMACRIRGRELRLKMCVNCCSTRWTRFFGGSVSSEGWSVQWESVPPGQESEAP